jgi:hypothetical protein
MAKKVYCYLPLRETQPASLPIIPLGHRLNKQYMVSKQICSHFPFMHPGHLRVLAYKILERTFAVLGSNVGNKFWLHNLVLENIKPFLLTEEKNGTSALSRCRNANPTCILPATKVNYLIEMNYNFIK